MSAVGKGLGEAGQGGDEGLEVSAEGGVAVVLNGEAIVGVGDFAAEGGVGEEALNLADDGGSEEAVHHGEDESLGFDVADEDGVAVDDDGNFEVEGFEEGVAKAFVSAEVGDEFGVGVGVPEGVGFASFVVGLAGVGDAVGNDAQINFFFFGEFLEEVLIFHAFVAGFVGDDEFAFGVFEAADKADGGLDAFARNDAGGLENDDVIFLEADVGFEAGAVFVRRGRFSFEFESVGN